ncbi:hypothetical protein CYMTET_29292 [Cymbomonas tetramitiformis]|uniref:GLTSCR protein conserved domain-containing protein n=1 Tax=Cymbomonas tetramitiformis TaxID=36881 RepID=A0AAE0FLD5_9CHLO|nr:hypothetical protein CYMTET_29292 [Cymbomonas tetramitiformis]
MNRPAVPSGSSLKRPAELPADTLKHKLLADLVQKDCNRACVPDINRPFSSAEDAFERLFPYHVFAQDESDDEGYPPEYSEEQDVTLRLSRKQAWNQVFEKKGKEFLQRHAKQLESMEKIEKKQKISEHLTGEEKYQIELLIYSDHKSTYEAEKAAASEKAAAEAAAAERAAAEKAAAAAATASSNNDSLPPLIPNP